MPTVQIPEIDRPTDEIPASDQQERRSMVDDGVDVPEAAEASSRPRAAPRMWPPLMTGPPQSRPGAFENMKSHTGFR
jgi:hypothetical protein